MPPVPVLTSLPDGHVKRLAPGNRQERDHFSGLAGGGICEAPSAATLTTLTTPNFDVNIVRVRIY
jgi:hypothetical protein